MLLSAKVEVVNSERFGQAGLLAIDEKLLHMLDGEPSYLFRSGKRPLLYSQMMSLGNIGKIVGRTAGTVERPQKRLRRAL